MLWVRYLETPLLIYLIYFIPVLHPQHKLAYFKKAGWEVSWVKIAETLVRDRFESDYNDIIEAVQQDPEASQTEDLMEQVRTSCIHHPFIAYWYFRKSC